MSLCIPIYKFIFVNIYLSIYLSQFVYICLSIYIQDDRSISFIEIIYLSVGIKYTLNHTEDNCYLMYHSIIHEVTLISILMAK